MIEGSTALKNECTIVVTSPSHRETVLFDLEKNGEIKPDCRFSASENGERAKGSFFIDLSILLIVGLFVLSSLSVAWYRQTSSLKQPRDLKNIQVQKGETLWQIASRYSPVHSDPRRFIAKIIEINGLPSSDVHEGQLIRVPVYAD
jgi:hypothetical protein